MKTILLFILFSNLLHAQSDPVFTIRTYGFPDIEEEYVLPVYKKWNIEYHPVAGCLVSEAFEDSIDKINQLTYLELEKKYGSDWRERLNLDLEKAKTNHDHLLSISIIDTIVRENDQFTETIYLYGDLSKMLVSLSPKQPFRNTQNNLPKLVNKSSIDTTILYRGYDNTFELVYTNLQPLVFTVKTSGSTLQFRDKLPLGNFHIHVKSSIKTVNILLTDSLNKIVESDFNVKNLEVPQVYLNNQVDGSILDVTSPNFKWEIYVKTDDPVVDQTYDLVIETWEIARDSQKVFHGTGNQLSNEVIEQLKNLQSGNRISFMINVRSLQSGILRRKSATFQIP